VEPEGGGGVKGGFGARGEGRRWGRWGQRRG
jgi:hypothetical protein